MHKNDETDALVVTTPSRSHRTETMEDSNTFVREDRVNAARTSEKRKCSNCSRYGYIEKDCSQRNVLAKRKKDETDS